MNNTLKPHPLPHDALCVNDLSLANPVDMIETQEQYEKILTGKTVSEGGVLPDDNIRVYVPLDLSTDMILYRLRKLYIDFGYPTEANELQYYLSVLDLITQLEIYDTVWREQNGSQNVHSEQGITLARKMITVLQENEGDAECFPYDVIERIEEKFDIR